MRPAWIIVIVLMSTRVFALTAFDLSVSQSTIPDVVGPLSAGIQVDVTNNSSVAAGPINLTVTLSGPPDVNFAVAYNNNLAPWSCSFTPIAAPTLATCTRPAGLKAGSSDGPQLYATSSSGSIQSCAQVSNAGGNVIDPDPTNNNDCTCVTVRTCRDVNIDLSTGFDGAKMTAGSADPDWVLVSGPSTLSGTLPRAATVHAPVGAWVNIAGAEWIGPASPDPEIVGTYVYEYEFGLPATANARLCTVQFDYAVDNSVTFTIDGRPIPTPAIGASSSSAFTTTHQASQWFESTAGQHTLQATVVNATGGTNPTGLLVHGTVQCYCPFLLPVFDPFSKRLEPRR